MRRLIPGILALALSPVPVSAQTGFSSAARFIEGGFAAVFNAITTSPDIWMKVMLVIIVLTLLYVVLAFWKRGNDPALNNSQRTVLAAVIAVAVVAPLPSSFIGALVKGLGIVATLAYSIPVLIAAYFTYEHTKDTAATATAPGGPAERPAYITATLVWLIALVYIDGFGAILDMPFMDMAQGFLSLVAVVAVIWYGWHAIAPTGAHAAALGGAAATAAGAAATAAGAVGTPSGRAALGRAVVTPIVQRNLIRAVTTYRTALRRIQGENSVMVTSGPLNNPRIRSRSNTIRGEFLQLAIDARALKSERGFGTVLAPAIWTALQNDLGVIESNSNTLGAIDYADPATTDHELIALVQGGHYRARTVPGIAHFFGATGPAEDVLDTLVRELGHAGVTVP